MVLVRNVVERFFPSTTLIVVFGEDENRCCRCTHTEKDERAAHSRDAVCEKRVGEWERSDRCAWPALFASCLHTHTTQTRAQSTQRAETERCVALEPLILGKCRSRYGKRRRRQLTSSAATLIWMDAAELALQIRKLVHSIREHLIRCIELPPSETCVTTNLPMHCEKKLTVRFNPLRPDDWYRLMKSSELIYDFCKR